MVFQNPFDTLNPSHSVGSQIMRTLEKFGVGRTVGERRQRMLELLDLVKLPRAFEKRMPRQLSGGQKQRIGVARAFAGHAKVVVADEPVSALDVSVQAAVTELLMDIQRQSKMTMLFISHDLSVVRYIADRVIVMYLGYIVEQGTTDQIFSPPYHPYTEALLSAIPIADTSARKKHIVLEGEIPSAMNPPSGCPFQTRCRYKPLVPDNLCEREVPPMRDLGGGHRSLCWLADDVLARMEPVITFDKEKPADRASMSPADDAPVGRAKATQRARAAGPGVSATDYEASDFDSPETRPSTPAEALETPEGVSGPAENQISTRPGESDPKKIIHQVGDGRQAASAEVQPAFAETREEQAGDMVRQEREPHTISQADSPMEAKAAMAEASALERKIRGARPAGIERPEAPDDLKRISGIGPRIEALLNGLGIYKYEQIAAWEKAECDWIDGYLNFRGRIERDDWVRQAAALARGGEAEHSREFGRKPR
jgi:peptide/nickel transport system ATP-binding protein